MRKRCYTVWPQQRSKLEACFPDRLNRYPPFSGLSKQRFKPRHMLEPRLRLGQIDADCLHQAALTRQLLT